MWDKEIARDREQGPEAGIWGLELNTEDDAKPQGMGGCNIQVCVSALYGVHTMTKSPYTAFLRTCPNR